MRPINNVVDISNLVMLELGHPLHAFDYDLFRFQGPSGQKKVVVRRAEDGEKFVTLDEVERTLNPEVLMIADGDEPVAIGGIMGGLKSEVSPTTRNVLLESAYFDPRVIRRGRMSLGLSTESSQRFERGADPNGVVKAANRAAELLEELAEGSVLKGTVDCYPSPIHPAQISLRPKRVNKLLGTDLSSQEIMKILGSLEIPAREGDDLKVEAPTFRPDLTREIDLVEEIARIHGYDKIETSLRASGSLVTKVAWEDELSREVKHLLAGDGFFEVITNNLVDPRVMAKLDPQAPQVGIKNPLSNDLSVLSTTLSYGLLGVVSWNKNRLEKNVRIFELGKVFLARPKGLPEERVHLGMAVTGSREPRHWQTSEAEVDLFDLKGVLEQLSNRFLLPLQLNPGRFPFLHADRCFQVEVGGERIGVLGEVSESVLDVFGIKDKVILAELDFEKLASAVPRERQLSPLPKFPPVDRDVAVVAEETLPSQTIRDKIKEVGGDLVVEVSLFDVYKGKQVPPGKKSLAYSIRYRSQEKTLTDEEVDQIHQKVVSKLKTSFGITLRE
jgi:phenylalanyl-tRNA synthetase beta chain